jgi:hypothetical protein
MRDSDKPFFVRKQGIRMESRQVGDVCKLCGQRIRNIAIGIGNEKLFCGCPQNDVPLTKGFGSM